MGCAASGSTGFGGGGSASTNGSGGSASNGTDATSSSSSLGGFSGTSSSATGGPAGPAEVFAESADTLFKLDPNTKEVTTIGQFQGCSSVIDIALDKDGVMYGTTSGGLYLIDKTNATCTLLHKGTYPNSLSFVPAGTVDATDEALVGYQGGTYVRIDKGTGAISTIGHLGSGYSSSGDIVSVNGGGTYLTVTGNGCGDCIVQVDPTTGALINNIGHLGHKQVFGLAFWAGVAYGFDNAGELFQIDLTTAATTVIPIPNAPSGLSFYGAGSTTSAPVNPG
jgi:hypothetical protein